MTQKKNNLGPLTQNLYDVWGLCPAPKRMICNMLNLHWLFVTHYLSSSSSFVLIPISIRSMSVSIRRSAKKNNLGPLTQNLYDVWGLCPAPKRMICNMLNLHWLFVTHYLSSSSSFVLIPISIRSMSVSIRIYHIVFLELPLPTCNNLPCALAQLNEMPWNTIKRIKTVHMCFPFTCQLVMQIVLDIYVFLNNVHNLSLVLSFFIYWQPIVYYIYSVNLLFYFFFN